jgi:hypothetical protein
MQLERLFSLNIQRHLEGARFPDQSFEQAVKVVFMCRFTVCDARTLRNVDTLARMTTKATGELVLQDKTSRIVMSEKE